MNVSLAARSSVPPRYVGLWRRLRLVDEEGAVDTSSQVLWLQTHALYADIRVPAGRPDFTGVTRLSECSDAQLKWLRGQQGFAGRLHVEGNICRWVHEIDYRPPGPLPDAGCVAFDRGTIIERGVYLPYEEEWRRSPGPGTTTIALRLQHELPRDPAASCPQGILLVVDDHFMFVHDRRAETAGDRDRLRALLDCEISFGLRIGGRIPWEVQLSTLPFREGQALFARAEAPVRQGDGTLLQVCATPMGTVTRRWAVSEWTAGFDGFSQTLTSMAPCSRSCSAVRR